MYKTAKNLNINQPIISHSAEKPLNKPNGRDKISQSTQKPKKKPTIK
jgi:hypothetical protein